MLNNRKVIVQLHALVCIVCGLDGCAPFVPIVDMKTVPLEERAAAAQVILYSPGSAGVPKFTYIGPVQGYSCKLLLTDPPASLSDAIEQIKLNTARLKGNGIIDFSCGRIGTDVWGTNCWNSFQCAGSAVRTQ